MNIIKKIFKNETIGGGNQPVSLKEKFALFINLLEKNNNVLKLAGDLEEKSHSDQKIRRGNVDEAIGVITEDTRKIIDNLVLLGGAKYAALFDIHARITYDIDNILQHRHVIGRSAFTVFLKDIDFNSIDRVGNKNYKLAELKNKLGLNAPYGFAITTWAYKYFMDYSNLQGKIKTIISKIDISKYEELEKYSSEIRKLILEAEIPDGLADEISRSYDVLKELTNLDRIAVRSSALGEDAHLSFAGQYASFLCVESKDILSKYKEVIASKYTPKALYYFLSHDIDESEHEMSAGIIGMINSAKSGVLYTDDPVDPDSGLVIINSIFGIGKYLVDGKISPDVFFAARESGQLIMKNIVRKEVMLGINESGYLEERQVPKEICGLPSLSEKEIRELIKIANVIRDFYGEPQDIEWAIKPNGEINVLQTRPLNTIEGEPAKKLPDIPEDMVLLKGGITVYPGGGAGKIKRLRSSNGLVGLEEGIILAADHPFPGLITAIGKANALLTKIGSMASHLATIAREYKLPTIFGIDDFDKLKDGELVTVDSKNAVIYKGIHNDLVEALKPPKKKNTSPMGDTLAKALKKITPLNLLFPNEPGFSADKCRTYHDITRFAHQKAIEEMFASVNELKGYEGLGVQLETDIPIGLRIVFIDGEKHSTKKKITNMDKIESLPLRAFWSGVEREGWPGAMNPGGKGLRSAVSANFTKNRLNSYSRQSYAFVTKEFMVLSLKMGYHFTTFEAMCVEDISSNYIKMQFKSGGAAIERRIRRITLLSEILKDFGFFYSRKGDFFDCIISYQPKDIILEKLKLLGRISMLTKQLDMALTNEKITDFYIKDIKRKLKEG